MNPAQLLEALKPVIAIAVVYADKPAPGENVLNMSGIQRGKTYETVARNITDALTERGFRAVCLPENKDLPDRLIRENVDIVWCNSGGVQGSGSMAFLAAKCEELGIPYIGWSPENVTRLDHKPTFKALCESAGIPTASPWATLRGDRVVTLHLLRRKLKSRNKTGRWVVKPASGRGSVNVSTVDTLADLPAAIARLRQETHNGEVLIEKFLEGAEYTAAFLGGPFMVRGGVPMSRSDGALQVTALIERKLEEGEDIWTPMDLRKITVDRLERTTGLPRALLEDFVRRLALEIGDECVCRVDIRADKDGKLHAIEMNPKPDLARPNGENTSIMCAELPFEGMDYNDLVETIMLNRMVYLWLHRPDLFAYLIRNLPEGDNVRVRVVSMGEAA